MRRISELRENLESVTASAHPLRIKRALLEGILGELRALAGPVRAQNVEASLSTQLKSEQAETYCTVSQLSVNSDVSGGSRILGGGEREELELKILQKQRIKVTLNEEIENFEDDYFHMQKVLLTKQEYLEQLDARIATRTYQISRDSCQRAAPPEPDKKSLTHRLKNFFLL